jgi:hypothetical protein
MRAREFMVDEDRWSEVKAVQPVAPKATPIARAMGTAARKKAKTNAIPKIATPPATP